MGAAIIKKKSKTHHTILLRSTSMHGTFAVSALVALVSSFVCADVPCSTSAKFFSVADVTVASMVPASDVGALGGDDDCLRLSALSIVSVSLSLRMRLGDSPDSDVGSAWGI
eukprot:CAMPEP_0172463196 /NCGR_PEP_ID=MMETSP1065-20121228/46300_1 /TAXON_ID=265537 /ORGANISM="Amphiprora paludosa, Strain CCMP125" /LENGTH=111 /DNA_ID=CAMNT_0013219085 /DNA_START=246 /DNA_END=581 /DNA_ORIENTATION=+